MSYASSIVNFNKQTNYPTPRVRLKSSQEEIPHIICLLYFYPPASSFLAYSKKLNPFKSFIPLGTERLKDICQESVYTEYVINIEETQYSAYDWYFVHHNTHHYPATYTHAYVCRMYRNVHIY